MLRVQGFGFRVVMTGTRRLVAAEPNRASIVQTLTAQVAIQLILQQTANKVGLLEESATEKSLGIIGTLILIPGYLHVYPRPHLNPAAPQNAQKPMNTQKPLWEFPNIGDPNIVP